MALTLEEVMAEINRIKEEYAGEDPDNTAQAISTFMLDNEVPEDLYRNAMSKVNEANYRGIAQSGLARGETAGGGDGTGVVKLTPIRSGEGVTYSAIPDKYTLADVQVAGRPMMNEAQLSQYLPYNPYDIEQRRAYELEGPRAVTFYDRILNRPVPVVTKGVFLPSRSSLLRASLWGTRPSRHPVKMDISGRIPVNGHEHRWAVVLVARPWVCLLSKLRQRVFLPEVLRGLLLSNYRRSVLLRSDAVKTADDVLTSDETIGTHWNRETFVFTGGNNTVVEDTVVEDSTPKT
jgi:hypothetical protein